MGKMCQNPLLYLNYLTILLNGVRVGNVYYSLCTQVHFIANMPSFVSELSSAGCYHRQFIRVLTALWSNFSVTKRYFWEKVLQCQREISLNYWHIFVLSDICHRLRRNGVRSINSDFFLYSHMHLEEFYQLFIIMSYNTIPENGSS